MPGGKTSNRTGSSTGALRFALEAREPIGIGGERIRESLERHVTIELRVARAIDLAHSAFADRSGDLVAADAAAWGESHEFEIIPAGSGP
jgi:hypothetical protein